MIKPLFVVTLGSLLSGVILTGLLLRVDPGVTSSNVLIWLLFLCLFWFVGCLATLIFFFLAELFKGKKLGLRKFHSALRRGFLTATFVVGVLILHVMQMLTQVEALLFFLFLAVMEWYFSMFK